MRHWTVLIAFIISLPSMAIEGGKEWLDQSGRLTAKESGTPVPETDIYEVVASKEYVAVLRDLQKRSFVEIDENLAKYFTGHYFRRKPGQKTYLVRTVSSNGGTGRYQVNAYGKSLLVAHYSLGNATRLERSALIINVEFEIEAVYLSVGGAI